MRPRQERKLRACHGAVSPRHEEVRFVVLDRLAPHTVQGGEPDPGIRGQRDVPGRRHERGSTEPAHVFRHVLRSDRSSSRRFHFGPLGAPTPSGAIRDLYADRLADNHAHGDIQRNPGRARLIGEGARRSSREGGVPDAKHPVSGRYGLVERDLRHRSGRRAAVCGAGVGHLPDTLREPATGGPDLDRVFRIDLRIEVDAGRVAAVRGDAAHQHTPIVGAAVAHHVVAALASQVRLGESSAERLFEYRHLAVTNLVLLRVRVGTIECRAVHAGDERHVLGALHAPLDLERRDPRPKQLGQHRDAREVLRRQQMCSGRRQRGALRVDQLVGQPAWLGAQTPVGRTRADQRRQQALARVAHADGAVHERLDLDSGRRARGDQLGHLLDRRLAREGHARDTAGTKHDDRRRAVGVELGRSVDPHVRQCEPHRADQTQVLQDDRIHAGGPGLVDQGEGFFEFGGQHDHIRRQVDSHAMHVREAACFRKRLEREVLGPSAGVELVHTQVHGIGTVGDRCAQRVKPTARGEKLGNVLFGRAHRRWSSLGTAG